MTQQEQIKVKVTYDSEILGADTFWEGTKDQLKNCRNIPAQMAVKKTFQDGKSHTIGMWKSEVVK